MDAKNFDIGMSTRASITSRAGIEGTARPRSTAETNARVRGVPNAAWVSSRPVRSRRSSSPRAWRHSGLVVDDRLRGEVRRVC